MRTLIRELVEKVIVYDDGPTAHRVRVVLNPGKVRPPDQPPDYVSTPFNELGTLLDRTVDGLPLPGRTAYLIRIRGFFVFKRVLVSL